jgi:hypothetical protein
METSQIAEIQAQATQAKQFAEFGQAIERLKVNRDFQKVVLEGYFREEAIRLVNAKASPECESPDKQRSIVTQIDAIGCFHGYLNTKLRLADIGAKQVAECEAAIEEIEAAEGEGS